MMRGSTQWFAGVAHGVLWKVLALLAKAAFLVIVAPGLPAGEFSAYVFLTTVALLAARFLSFGISDQLVIEVRGAPAEAGRYVPLFRGLFSAGVVATASAAVASGPWVAAALAMVLVAGAVLEGLLRSCTPAHYERLTNLAPILFLAGCMVVEPTTSHDLVGLFTAATILSQLISAGSSGIGLRSTGVEYPPGLSSMVDLARRGAGKMVAELTLLANMRAILLWPKLLSGTLASDSIAFAISIAEAVSTIPMVVVNRNYARFASATGPSPPPLRSAAGSALLMAFFGAAAMGLPAVAGLMDFAIVARIRVTELAWAMAYLGVVTAYYDLRYHAWSQGLSSRPFTASQLAFLLVQGAAVWLLPAQEQLAAITLAAGSGVVAWLLLTRASQSR